MEVNFYYTQPNTSFRWKTYSFGHVVSGQDVVNAITQNDVINSIVIIRNGKEAKKI